MIVPLSYHDSPESSIQIERKLHPPLVHLHQPRAVQVIRLRTPRRHGRRSRPQPPISSFLFLLSCAGDSDVVRVRAPRRTWMPPGPVRLESESEIMKCSPHPLSSGGGGWLQLTTRSRHWLQKRMRDSDARAQLEVFELEGPPGRSSSFLKLILVAIPVWVRAAAVPLDSSLPASGIPSQVCRGRSSEAPTPRRLGCPSRWRAKAKFKFKFSVYSCADSNGGSEYCNLKWWMGPTLPPASLSAWLGANPRYSSWPGAAGLRRWWPLLATRTRSLAVGGACEGGNRGVCIWHSREGAT